VAKPPVLLKGFVYLWDVFRRLDATRAVGFNGATRLTYAELEAYSRLTGFPLDAWEVEALMQMDEAVLVAKSGD
jgi:hypothetical protein